MNPDQGQHSSLGPGDRPDKEESLKPFGKNGAGHISTALAGLRRTIRRCGQYDVTLFRRFDVN
jgi:hypothetical protein